MPCKFNYPINYIPKCHESHADSIIPLVYGKPTNETIKKRKNNKLHLAGCMKTGGASKYYCEFHNEKYDHQQIA
jgi:hypothetical protein